MNRSMQHIVQQFCGCCEIEYQMQSWPLLSTCYQPHAQSLADPELQKRGAKFCPKFLKCHLSPKISDDLFLSIDLFHVSMCYFSVGEGGQIRSRHRYGGAKILTFRQIHNAIITLSAPEGGQTHCQLRWGGPWPDLPPWIRHCAQWLLCNPTIATYPHPQCTNCTWK